MLLVISEPWSILIQNGFQNSRSNFRREGPRLLRPLWMRHCHLTDLCKCYVGMISFAINHNLSWTEIAFHPLESNVHIGFGGNSIRHCAAGYSVGLYCREALQYCIFDVFWGVGDCSGDGNEEETLWYAIKIMIANFHHLFRMHFFPVGKSAFTDKTEWQFSGWTLYNNHLFWRANWLLLYVIVLACNFF